MKKLFKGARVALVAPSGCLSQQKVQKAVDAIEKYGLEPVVFDSCYAKHGYLAGNDRLRAADLQRAFEDPSIDGVLCARGGYGAHRLLRHLDLSAIKRNPKIFCGYSDVTALHVVFNQLGMPTFHTPMPASEWARKMDPYSETYLLDALFGRITSLENPDGEPFCTLVPGFASGPLCGGNLSLLCRSLGTPYEIDTRSKILFLEDIDEDVYRVDSMLTQLKNAGKLSACAAIVLGLFTNCNEEEPGEGLSLSQVFEDLLLDEGKPIISGLCCGHSLKTMCLPLGATAILDTNSRSILIQGG